MPTVRTECPVCGLVIDFEIGQCALLGDENGHPVAYAFVCPHCHDPVVREADRRSAALLVAGGASPCGANEPVDGPVHPEQSADGPAFTADDLLDFHLMLESTAWFSDLADAVGEQWPGYASSPAPESGSNDSGHPRG